MASGGTETSYTFTGYTEDELDIFGPIYEFFKKIAARGVEALVESASLSICFVMPAFRSTSEFIAWYKTQGKDHLSFDSPGDNILQPGETLTVTPGVSELPAPQEQSYAEGIHHCLFTLMLQWAETALGEAKSNTARKRYRTIIYRLTTWINEYRDGVPQSFVHKVAQMLQVAIYITNPLSKKIHFSAKPEKKPLKTFWFENTSLNHVDPLILRHSDEPIRLTPEEMEEKLMELRNDDVPRFHWRQTQQGTVWKICTSDAVFVTESAYTRLVDEFERSSGLDCMKLSQRRTPDLFNFVMQSVHWNNFMEVQNYEEAASMHPLRCIDIKASYLDPHSSPFYDGFPTKFTDLQPCSEMHGPGVYRVTNISWGWAHPKIEEICKRVLGNIFVDNAVYCHPFLNQMEHYGVRFDIVEGAWAGGMQPSIDIKMPGERMGKGGTGFYMRASDTKKACRAYCMYIGQCGRMAEHEEVWIHASDQFLSVCAKHCEDVEVQASFVHFPNENKGRVRFPRKDLIGLPQVAAYTNAYECTKIIAQLMLMDLSKIVNLKKDSITYIDHGCEVLHYFKHERVKRFPNGSFHCYLDNLPHEMDGPLLRLPSNYVPREQHSHEAHIGCGGGGKTTAVLTAPALQGVVVLNLSHKQCAEMQKKFGVRVEVYANADSTDPSKTCYLHRTMSVAVSDEASQRSQEDHSRFLHMYPFCKHISIGDVGYQMPPISRQTAPLPYGTGTWRPLYVPPCGLEGAVRAVTPGTVHDPLPFSGTLWLPCVIPYQVFVSLQGMSAERFMKLKDFGEESNKLKKFKAQFSRAKALTNQRSFTCTENGDVRVLEPYAFAQDGFPGRLFSRGAQGLFRDLRSNLFNGKMDLDQNAAMHRIIEWLCKVNGIPCPELTNYVQNRDAVLASIVRTCRCSMKDAKNRVQIAFTDTRVRKSRSDKLTRLRVEADRIRKALARSERHAWVLKKVSEHAPNRLGKFISRLYQPYENLFTCLVMFALKDAGITTHAMLFDGLIIDSIPSARQAWVLEMAKAQCEAVCPGIGMEWAFKPIRIGAVNLLDEPFDPIRCPCTEITPEYLRSYGPVFEYNENRRAQNCPELLALLEEVRAMTGSGAKKEVINSFIKAYFAKRGRVVTKAQLMEMYDPRRDTIVAARRSHIAEYTEMLSPKDGKENKFRVTARGEGYNNGEYIVAVQPPPKVACVPRHAQTTNEIQGTTLPEDERLFCDTRDIFDRRHPYVNLSRAQYLHQLYLIEEWTCDYQLEGRIYIIRSASTDRVYIGHTVNTLDQRLKEHLRCDKCTSRYVTRYGDATIELLETVKFTLKADIEERESQVIMEYPTAVNAVLPQTAQPPIRPAPTPKPPSQPRAPKRKAAAKEIAEGAHKKQSKLPF